MEQQCLGQLHKKLWLCSCTCWLQRDNSSTWRGHDPPQQYCFQKWKEKAENTTMNEQIFQASSFSLSSHSPYLHPNFWCFVSHFFLNSLSCCKANTSATLSWGDKRKLHGSSHQAPGLPAFICYIWVNDKSSYTYPPRNTGTQWKGEAQVTRCWDASRVITGESPAQQCPSLQVQRSRGAQWQARSQIQDSGEGTPGCLPGLSQDSFRPMSGHEPQW